VETLNELLGEHNLNRMKDISKDLKLETKGSFSSRLRKNPPKTLKTIIHDEMFSKNRLKTLFDHLSAGNSFCLCNKGRINNMLPLMNFKKQIGKPGALLKSELKPTFHISSALLTSSNTLWPVKTLLLFPQTKRLLESRIMLKGLNQFSTLRFTQKLSLVFLRLNSLG